MEIFNFLYDLELKMVFLIMSVYTFWSSTPIFLTIFWVWDHTHREYSPSTKKIDNEFILTYKMEAK